MNQSGDRLDPSLSSKSMFWEIIAFYSRNRMSRKINAVCSENNMKHTEIHSMNKYIPNVKVSGTYMLPLCP
jgi:hypothetical protein